MCNPQSFHKSSLFRRWLCLFAAALSATCFSYGREPAKHACDDARQALPKVLSLAEARRIAFLRNWDLLAAQANVDLAVAQEIVSHEFPNPTFSYSTSKISADSSSNGTRMGNGIWNRNYDTIFAFNQLFEIGGKRALRQKSAIHGRKAAEASFRDARRVLDMGVSKTYIAVLLAEADGRILRDSAASLRQEADIGNIRLRAGDISESDKAQIDIAADQLELNAEAQKSTAAAARVALEVLLGVKVPKGDWTPADTLEKLAANTYSGHGGSIDQRPDVVSAEESVRKAESDLGLQKAMRIPDPTFSLQYERNPPDLPNTVGFGISFPLPFWNSNRGNIKVAEAARKQAEDQLGKTRAQAEADVTSAKVALAEASYRWHRFRNSIAPKSAKEVKIIEYAYRKGGVALLDLLQAQRTDNDIRVAAAQAMADAATASEALLNALNIRNQ